MRLDPFFFGVKIQTLESVLRMLSDAELLQIEVALEHWLSEMLEVNEKFRATIERVHAQGYHVLISNTSGEIEVEIVKGQA